MSKSAEAFRTIGEVADELGIPKHVLRFWEGRFPQIRPMKRGGGRRYYRPEDMELLREIRTLLHAEGYTIRGVQKILREHGIDQVKDAARRAALPPVAGAEPAARKRGRKPIAGVAATAPAQTANLAGSSGSVQAARVASKTRLMTAIRELEIARAILSGKPIISASETGEAKKGRAGSP